MPKVWTLKSLIIWGGSLVRDFSNKMRVGKFNIEQYGRNRVNYLLFLDKNTEKNIKISISPPDKESGTWASSRYRDVYEIQEC